MYRHPDSEESPSARLLHNPASSKYGCLCQLQISAIYMKYLIKETFELWIAQLKSLTAKHECIKDEC